MILGNKYPPPTRGTLVVWGLMAAFPFGGMTWQVLHHLAGLRRLGFDVWYVEDSDRLVMCPTTFCHTWEYAPNVTYLSKWMDSVGLGNRWVFRPPGNIDSCLGAINLTGLKRLYKEADAVLNLCGAQELRDDHTSIQCLIYMETDPVAMQVAVAKKYMEAIRILDVYDHLFTYGTNLGAPDCLVPIERYQWHHTLPPVCVDWWVNTFSPNSKASLTTIANWKHTGKDVVWNGETWHWSKHYEFLRFINLPLQSSLPLELAVGSISKEERVKLSNHGWRIARSLTDPIEYQEYIKSSIGEFTASKEQYVRPRSGWFSDRSVCYLAAGRPVITQDTGFGNCLPTGEGLFPFATEDEALKAIDSVARDYARHSTAALEIAHEYFDAEVALGEVLSKVGLM